jgi:hypothetical protein
MKKYTNTMVLLVATHCCCSSSLDDAFDPADDDGAAATPLYTNVYSHREGKIRIGKATTFGNVAATRSEQ